MIIVLSPIVGSHSTRKIVSLGLFSSHLSYYGWATQFSSKWAIERSENLVVGRDACAESKTKALGWGGQFLIHKSKPGNGSDDHASRNWRTIKSDVGCVISIPDHAVVVLRTTQNAHWIQNDWKYSISPLYSVGAMESTRMITWNTISCLKISNDSAVA